MSANQNIATLISHNAKQLTQNKAIISLIKNQHKQVTFEDVDYITNQYANGFVKSGIKKGTKVLMLVPHSIEFYLVIFGLFKAGAVPIIIDPGMRKKDLLNCIEQADAEAMVGIPLAFMLKTIFKRSFRSIKIKIIVGRKYFFNAISLSSFKTQFADKQFEMVSVKSDDLAAILFTSGSTGAAKGVEYEHGMFYHQAITIKEMFQLKPGLSDMPCFPLFGLFSLSLGVTLYLPDINTSFPAKADPAKIVNAINDFKITNCFASPAIWVKIINYCVLNKCKLLSLKNSMAAGAPIDYKLLIDMKKYVLPDDGEMWVPYGATESLPVSVITSTDRLKANELQLHQIASINVGKSVKGVQIKIIESTDSIIESIQHANVLAPLQIGEIIVNSPSTTKTYYKRDDKTKLSKIFDGNTFWHRMGDVGFLDQENTLWYCGRKDHVVKLENGQTLYSIPCELVANQHESVFRSALVGIRNQNNESEAVIVIEQKTLMQNGDTFEAYVNKFGDDVSSFAVDILTFINNKLGHSNIKKLLFYDKLPVDVRHNAKINREFLAKWAQEQKFFYEIQS